KLTSFPLLTMSHYTDEPRFTIEQIDLLQRLRRSGMTKQEILHALDTLDRLDREHVEKFGHRHAHGGSGAASVNHASSSTISTATQTGYRGNGLSPSPSNSYDTSPPPTVPTPVPVVAPLVQNGRDLAAMPNGKLSPPRFAVMGNSRDGTAALKGPSHPGSPLSGGVMTITEYGHGHVFRTGSFQTCEIWGRSEIVCLNYNNFLFHGETSKFVRPPDKLNIFAI
uniref:Homeobox containing 1 n=1 Tax=Sinocyclocheilus rhinocerous TaxID=307959 RepID=A0A673NHA2_9TELE